MRQVVVVWGSVAADHVEGRHGWLAHLGPVGWAGLALTLVASVVLIAWRRVAGGIPPLAGAAVWGVSLGVALALINVDLDWTSRSPWVLPFMVGVWLLVTFLAYLRYQRANGQRG